MNILGIGNDIVQTSRIRAIAESRLVERFARRMLHPEHELKVLHRYNDIEKKTQFLASTWAAKEALYKSLLPAEQKNCRFNQWYRTRNELGQRTITEQTYLQNHPNEHFLLSVSHDGDYTSAIVLRCLKSS